MSSIFPVDASDVETFTVVTNPIRSYTSSSLLGVTGSIYIFAHRSLREKDASGESSFVDAAHDDSQILNTLRQAQYAGRTARSSPLLQATFSNMISSYVDKVTAEGSSTRFKQLLDVVRFTPPVEFNSNTLRKLIVKDTLQKFYRTSYPTAHWAYTNYNSLNFFTASSVPSTSAILYPNIDRGQETHVGFCSGTYTPSGSFSFDFYINARYQPDSPNGTFKAGTILHLSSTYALSLVSGSSKDPNGRPQCFRLQLQLSHSADVSPSLAAPGVSPNDLVFLSDDNALLWNNWHHVVVRWGTSAINNGTGSFNVDGIDRGTFVVPLDTIAPKLYGGLQGSPTILALGNFFEGPNRGTSLLANYFAINPATRDGLNVLLAQSGIEQSISGTFKHPLNAELHDIAIRRCYLSDADISFSASIGPTFLDDTFAFYVPPFFVEQSPYRQFFGTHGGILVTPFQEIDGATTTPFSVAMSFGVGGHMINLENFVKDFANNIFPRLHHLTGSAIGTSTGLATSNQYLYAQPFVVKRNLTILPCDDGNFVPGFQLLTSETLSRAIDDMGVEELSFINIDNLVASSTLMFGGGTFDDGTQPASSVNAFADIQTGHTPEQPFNAAGPAFASYSRSVMSGSDVEAGAPLTIYQRTQDPSSNQVTFFDISNLFYGFKISPTTFSMQDASLSGSNGRIKITLADDGRGNMYRADALTTPAKWNSVGNIYYDEGLVVVKSPHVFFFGQDAYSMNFRGEQHVHVMKIDSFAQNNSLNSSSNPSFVSLAPNGYPNDVEDEFVYISGINFHDRDLNVVLKTSLAQPILKRSGDRMLFKTKFDF